MTTEWSADAQAILDDLQARVAARDLPALVSLFEDPAVLIATASDGRTPEAREAYLRAIAAQPAEVRWEWHDKVLFYEATDALGFAAFGDVVLAEGVDEVRAPIRGTFFAVRSKGGWRLRQFHGSFAQSPN